jgi:predicted  nucleic acid-binding Zn-ribbon protein
MSTIEKLLAYQAEDAKLFDIEKKLNESDARKKGIQATRFLRSVADTLASIEAKAQELNTAYESAQAELQKLDEESEEFKTIAKNVSDENEISYLKGRASKLAKTLDELLRKIQKLEQDMNELAVQYTKLKKDTVAYQEQYEKSGAEYAKLKESSLPARKAIEEKLKEIADGIPPVIMEKYTEKRKDKQFPIVYKISAKDKHCTACGTELSLKQLDELKKKDNVFECENCRKLLFMES